MFPQYFVCRILAALITWQPWDALLRTWSVPVYGSQQGYDGVNRNDDDRIEKLIFAGTSALAKTATDSTETKRRLESLDNVKRLLAKDKSSLVAVGAGHGEGAAGNLCVLRLTASRRMDPGQNWDVTRSTCLWIFITD